MYAAKATTDNAAASNLAVVEKKNVPICAYLLKDAVATVAPFRPVVFLSWKRINYGRILAITD